MYRQFFIIFSILFLGNGLLTTKLIAQDVQYNLRFYGFEEGLSHRNVFSIAQDDQGFIWLSTINGLNRFDGDQFLQFNSNNSERRIAENYVKNVLVDSNGTLYLLGQSGLGVMDASTYKYERIKLSDQYEALLFIRLLGVDDSGVVLLTYNTTAKQWVVWRVDPNRQVELVQEQYGLQSNQGLFYADTHFFSVSNQGILSQHSNSGEILLEKDLNPLIGETEFKVADMTFIGKKRLAILLEDGRVLWFNLTTGETTWHERFFKSIPNSNFNELFIEKDGGTWIGGKGVLLYHKKGSSDIIDFHKQIEREVRFKTEIRAIFKDRTGIMWIATDYGAIQILRKQKLFEHYLNEGDANCNNGFCSTRGMAEDENGNVYISYYNSIHRIDAKTREISPLYKNENFTGAPFGLMAKDGYLWMGNGLRINTTSLAVDTILKFDKSDTGVVIEDDNGLIWYGYRKHLITYDPKLQILNTPGTTFEVFGSGHSENEEITYLLKGKDYLWLGTNSRGVFKLDWHEGLVAHYHTESAKYKLNHNRILAIQQDGKGNVWVATAHGINHIDFERDQVRSITTADGLPNDFINGLLLEGDSILWASTDNGLSRIEIASGFINNFFKKDGLSANEFNRISFLKSGNGRMYFGGMNGVNVFDPKPAFGRQKQESEAALIWTAFSKYDGLKDSLIREINPGRNLKEVIIHHSDRFFGFEYALANYEEPGNIRYAFQLEGFDVEWSKPQSEHYTRFNNIPAGRYTFKVKAAINGGNWNNSLLSIPVIIKKAFYKTTWFYSLLAVLTAIFIFGTVRYRVYRLRKRQAVLELEVQERTRQLQTEKEKSEALLLNILPEETAEELKKYGKAKAKRHEEVTVMFSDFKNFTQSAELMEPEALIDEIDGCFRAFDRIIETYDLEKIKTIGDAYMCAGGLDGDPEKGVKNIVKAALDIQEYLKQLKAERAKSGEKAFEARIGVATGTVVAGVVGKKKFAYDIWGNTVNIASRMETNGLPGSVNIAEGTKKLLDESFQYKFHDKFITKNQQEIKMYFVQHSRNL